ncbi:SRPBCC family protein [Amycolatopsis suaedae]|uniref:SRPBCC domain-containing protein n=1 Tax=Amycolatopsis suaedae TaxID=2510978 RepID=A0A4Q7J775_9PSEU|nr:SRPBCC domain-containing protein [Amycolatopsis suaedae]RZQ63017.1 SRPBCC domain-containing protein [Amycolatopsis suaedae]
MTDTPRIEVTIAAPPDQVWQALRDPDLIRRWHGWHFDGLDAEIRTIFVDDVTADADAHVLTAGGGDRFSLHPTERGTTVRVTRAPRGTDPEWAAYYDDITEGWITFLHQLRFGLERHGLAERTTVFLADLPARPLYALVPDLPATGERYSAELPTGDRVRGTVYARTDHQTFLTVDEFGDGLLAVAEKPGMLVLTAYGLDATAAADLERRWTAWAESVRTPENAQTR